MLSHLILALAAAVHWCAANEDQLATVALLLLPTLITGLSRHPTPATNELIEGLQMILARCSVLHHTDAPGTFKLLGTASGAPQTAGTARGA